MLQNHYDNLTSEINHPARPPATPLSRSSKSFVDKHKNTLEQLPSTNLVKEEIYEEQMLQQYIINSWKDFKNEISLPNSFIIGQRINPDDSTQNLLDILAFDADDLSMVVIELKRNKDKYQPLQGLSYASMIARWDKDRLINEIQKQRIGEYEDLN